MLQYTQHAVPKPTSHILLVSRHEAKQVMYRFFATPDGAPRRLDMHGTNALSGAHYDHWCGRVPWRSHWFAQWCRLSVL